MDGASGGFRGGGGAHSARAPLWNCFVQMPPLLKRKKNVSEHRNVSDLPPPPPPVWDLRDSRRWWRSEKKGRNPPPPPPPPLIRPFFGTCATFEAGAVKKINSVLCPPPFIKILDPPLDGAMERWEEGKWMWGKQRMKINHCYLFMTDLHYVTCSHCIFLKGSDKIWKLVQGLR